MVQRKIKVRVQCSWINTNFYFSDHHEVYSTILGLYLSKIRILAGVSVLLQPVSSQSHSFLISTLDTRKAAAAVKQQKKRAIFCLPSLEACI